MFESSQGHVRAWWLGEHEKKFHFYLAVKPEMTEALWTHGDTLEEAIASGEWQGLAKSSGGSCGSCPAPNIRYLALPSPGPWFFRTHHRGKGEVTGNSGSKAEAGVGAGGEDDLKIHHPNYDKIMNSYKYMVHIIFISLNSAFRKGLCLWQRLSQRVWKSRFAKVTFKILKTAF